MKERLSKRERKKWVKGWHEKKGENVTNPFSTFPEIFKELKQHGKMRQAATAAIGVNMTACNTCNDAERRRKARSGM